MGCCQFLAHSSTISLKLISYWSIEWKEWIYRNAGNSFELYIESNRSGWSDESELELVQKNQPFAVKLTDFGESWESLMGTQSVYRSGTASRFKGRSHCILLLKHVNLIYSSVHFSFSITLMYHSYTVVFVRLSKFELNFIILDFLYFEAGNILTDL